MMRRSHAADANLPLLERLSCFLTSSETRRNEGEKTTGAMPRCLVPCLVWRGFAAGSGVNVDDEVALQRRRGETAKCCFKARSSFDVDEERSQEANEGDESPRGGGGGNSLRGGVPSCGGISSLKVQVQGRSSRRRGRPKSQGRRQKDVAAAAVTG